jgi:hypothetical protein
MTEQIDWPVLTHKLRFNGVSTQEMSAYTGISKQTINLILDEKYDMSQFNKIVSLLVLFREVTDEEFPRLGDYHPGFDERIV